MNINVYVINVILVLMVIRQIREHPLDLRSLAVPVLAVGCAAVLFLHSVPAGGNDIALELACVLAGAAMGAVGGLTTRLRLGADGRPQITGLGGGAGHDGTSRCAHPAGRYLPARTPAGCGLSGHHGPHRGRRRCLIWNPGPPRATLCP
jgi:hypothetical protein